jgi:hypothetical protein
MNELTGSSTRPFWRRSKNFRAQGEQKAPLPPPTGRFSSETALWPAFKKSEKKV